MKAPINLGRRSLTCTARWHGTSAAYRYGCRCPHARECKRIEDKRRLHGRYVSPLVDGTGTARRVRALVAIGWPYTQIAARLGCSWQAVQHLALRTSPAVQHRTYRRVAVLYRDLSGVPGPSASSRRRAVVKGWSTPIAWGRDIDDPAAQPFDGDDGDARSA